jgi:hypothetical protein
MGTENISSSITPMTASLTESEFALDVARPI